MECEGSSPVTSWKQQVQKCLTPCWSALKPGDLCMFTSVQQHKRGDVPDDDEGIIVVVGDKASIEVAVDANA